jgi:DNA-binding winged helix-turn-helix (wHTH) protein
MSAFCDIITCEVIGMDSYSEEVAMLIAQTGPLNGQRWPLRRSILVGRDATCDIIVADRQVSRYHARFNLSQERIILEDLGSKNGTHVNGQRLLDEVQLQDGDVIQIALAQKFVYLSSDSTVPLEMYGQVSASLMGEVGELEVKRGRLHLDKRSRRVWIGETEVIPHLSVSQYHLLELLFEKQGQVVQRSDLVLAVWGKEQAYEISEQALDALVRRLRDRISMIDPENAYITTVRGHGLRLDNPPVE